MKKNSVLSLGASDGNEKKGKKNDDNGGVDLDYLGGLV